MMARQHVPLSGLATLTIVSTLGGVNPFIPIDGMEPFIGMCDPVTLFLLTLMAQAFGMVPDIDHPNATITKKLGAVGAILQPIVSWFSGGHRKGAHSWVFVLMMGMFGAFLTSLSSADRFQSDDFAPWINDTFGLIASLSIWIIAAFVALCTSFSIRLILPQKLNKSARLMLLVSIGAGALVVMNPDVMATPWLIIAMALGTFFHDIGDMMTTGMVPFLWPLYKKPLGIPVVGRTGSMREVFIVGPLLTFALAMSYAILIIKPAIPDIQRWVTTTVGSISQSAVTIPQSTLEITIQGAFIAAAALAIFDLLTRIFFPPRFQGGH